MKDIVRTRSLLRLSELADGDLEFARDNTVELMEKNFHAGEAVRMFGDGPWARKLNLGELIAWLDSLPEEILVFVIDQVHVMEASVTKEDGTVWVGPVHRAWYMMLSWLKFRETGSHVRDGHTG